MIEVYSPLILKNNSSNACGRDREGAKCDQMLRASLASHASATSGPRHVTSSPTVRYMCISHDLARAYKGHISLPILTNGHRPYNILINLFDTQCNLFICVEVARHTQFPRADSPRSSRIYITGIFIQLSQLTEYKHRINYSLIYTHKTFALRRYGVEMNLFRQILQSV